MEGGPTKEKREYPHILDLFDLKEDQAQELYDRIERWKGTIRVFIHPETMNLNSEKNSDILCRLLFSEKDTPPVIMFNDERYADIYESTVGENSNRFTNDLYTVHTLPNYPYPVINDSRLVKPNLEDRPGGILADADSLYVHETMSRLVNCMKVLGVKKIFVGGRDLDNVKGDINRCVGNFIRYMKELSDIEVKVSLATEGDISREDLRKSFPELL